MQTPYSTHGLALRSSFALPGMTPGAAEGLPSLSLQMRTPAQLDELWSGAIGAPTWQGRLGDGMDLTLEQGVADDALFSYGDRARFRLDPTGMTLDCAPSQAGLDWQRTLISKVLPTISMMRGYEALHAGVVDTPDGVVAIAGPSGAGKSTLVVELLRRGRVLFADDVLTLQSTEGTVWAHPGSPHMNLDESLPVAVDPLTLGDTLGFLAGERWLKVHRTVDRPRPVHMVCLLQRGPGLALETRRSPANPLLLTPYVIGLPSDSERERSRFSLYADLIESATLLCLTASFDHRPEQLADLLEHELAGAPQAAAGALA
jgi:hypothetical protein